MPSPTLHVAAALIVDATGRYLLVRKRGTTAFMQAGGKIEPGESPHDALVREVAEELGVHVTADQVRPLGHHDAPAANEPGHRISAHVFAVDGVVDAVPTAEIAEAVWVDLEQAARLPLAPLTATLLGLHPSTPPPAPGATLDA
ncbi:NUDIX hydrolase [Cellulomonas soli]